MYSCIDDQKCDQYRWHHYERKKLHVPPIIKSYYVLIQADGSNHRFRFAYMYHNSLYRIEYLFSIKGMTLQYVILRGL